MIGAAVKRKEDPRLLMGDSMYTGDVDLKGMVHMVVLRSPHGHARIRNIDVSQARSHPQVLAALTGEEVK
ncbi:MAG TPA: xanthine dehydrogenase family protein molybdopterin-binding subunit, partial [Dehalococcoidia bacterium]|nr:xanthine dehydrogenase family protein molybdopterin-binding subunit [Dehalococcoidia bacterium]